MDIRKLRKTAGLTQVELAEKAGLSQAYISGLEGGVLHLRPEMARRLERPLGVSWKRLWIESNADSLTERIKKLSALKSAELDEIPPSQLKQFLQSVKEYVEESVAEGELDDELRSALEKLLEFFQYHSMAAEKAKGPESKEPLDFGGRDSFGRKREGGNENVVTKNRDGLAEQNARSRQRVRMRKEKMTGLDFGNRDEHGRRKKKSLLERRGQTDHFEGAGE